VSDGLATLARAMTAERRIDEDRRPSSATIPAVNRSASSAAALDTTWAPAKLIPMLIPIWGPHRG